MATALYAVVCDDIAVFHMRPEDILSTPIHPSQQTITLDRSAALRSAPTASSPTLTRAIAPVVTTRLGQQEPVSAVGILVGILALAAATVVLFGRQLGLRWQWGRTPERGRWVRDRTLGGKLVFIPATESSTAPALMSWDVDTSEPRVAAGVADPELYKGVLDSPTRTQSKGPPAWWAPYAPPALPVSAAARQDAQKEGRALLKALEDSKLLGGADYSVDQLIALKRLCKVCVALST